MPSIDGLKDEDHAHLSESAREKLKNEREAGQKRVQAAKERMDLIRQSQADQQTDAEEGQEGIETKASADTLTGQRQAAHDQRTEDAELVRERNARIAAEKELADAREQLAGRAAPHPAAAAAAADLVRQRTEQAKEIGLQPGTPFIGHPETSDVQAENAGISATKEVSDRAQSAGYDAAGPYAGVTEDVAVAKVDEWGEPITEDGEGEDEGEGEGEQPAQHFGAETSLDQGNGQPPYSAAEQTATDMVAAEQPRRNRRRAADMAKQNQTRAVGDGPKSE